MTDYVEINRRNWDERAAIHDLTTGGLFVSFDKFEHGGRKFAGAARRLRCTDRLLKVASIT
jgi:hypothetical protein